MTSPVEIPDSDNPVDSPASAGSTVPNPETGVGIGASDEPNSFEPEEDPEAVGAPIN